MEPFQKPAFPEPTKYDSVFWIEADRIDPNPYQPRREFDEERLRSLAESIRQYGVLQPLVVTRKDMERPDGGLSSRYELIAGERRLRASKLIGLREVPVVIRGGEQTDHMKLELAIVENLQREDLNSIDRAKSLAQLAEEFGLSHAEIGAKIGRSREFVSNSIRLLALPEVIQQGVIDRKLTEGHARALLMLADRPQEQDTLFKEILMKKTSVRMAEQLARRIAQDRVRKHTKSPEMLELEKNLTEALGTRVVIEPRPNGGRLFIEFFSPEDLTNIAAVIVHEEGKMQMPIPQPALASQAVSEIPAPAIVPDAAAETELTTVAAEPLPMIAPAEPLPAIIEPTIVTPAAQPAPKEPEEDLYSVSNFTV